MFVYINSIIFAIMPEWIKDFNWQIQDIFHVYGVE